jgi:hypothetical protein
MALRDSRKADGACLPGRPPRVADRPAKRILGLMSWRSTDPANDRGPHHRSVKGGVALADDFLADRVMIGAGGQQ